MSLLLLAIFSVTTKAEPTYNIHETQLLKLIENLQKLKTDSENNLKLIADLRQISKEQEEQIKILKEQLSESETIIKRLKEESTISKELIAKAEESLTNASESFEIYKKAAEAKIRKLTVQRNLLIVVTVISLIL